MRIVLFEKWRRAGCCIPVPRIVRRFRKDGEGAVAIEFALVAVPFLGLLFAIFETALIFFTIQGVEATTAEAARHIMTGQTQTNTAVTNADQFKTRYMCEPVAPMVRILPSYVNCSKLIVDIRTANSFATAPLDNSFITEPVHRFCTGNESQIVVLRVAYPMPVFLSVLAMDSLRPGGIRRSTSTGMSMFDGKLTHMIISTSTFRNEPFSSIAPMAGC